MSEAHGSPAEVSKTQMLRSVLKDVSTLRSELGVQQQTIEQISTWAKSTVKPGMQQLQGTRAYIIHVRASIARIKFEADDPTFCIDLDTMTSENGALKEQIESTDAYARGVSVWIKDNLGTKLEILDAKIEAGIEARQKASEASLWAIFSAKLEEAGTQFDKYRLAMDDKHKELEEQVTKMRDELKRSNALRAKAETSVKHLEETFARLTRERADEEAQLFRKLTMKLEDERRAIEDERRKMADERKKYKHLLEKHKFEAEKTAVSTASSAVAPSQIAPFQASLIDTIPVARTASPPIITTIREATKPHYASVAQWLKEIGFEEYVSTFTEFGYSSLHLAQLLDEGDLDIMSITKPGHRKALISAASELSKARLGSSGDTQFTLGSETPSTSSPSSIAPTAKASAPSNPNVKRPLPKITKAALPATDSS